MKSAAAFFLRYLLIAGAIAGAYLFESSWRALHICTAWTPLLPCRRPFAWFPIIRSMWRAGPLGTATGKFLCCKEQSRSTRSIINLLIQLGLNAEITEGDPKTAESYYLKAAAVNKMFLPKWTLTNYYFRQQNYERVFPLGQ